MGTVGRPHCLDIPPSSPFSVLGRGRWKTEGRLGTWSHFPPTHSVLFSFSPRPRSLHPAWHNGEEKNPDLTHSGPKESAGEFTGWKSGWEKVVLGTGPSLGKGLSIWGNCEGMGSLEVVSGV